MNEDRPLDQPPQPLCVSNVATVILSVRSVRSSLHWQLHGRGINYENKEDGLSIKNERRRPPPSCSKSIVRKVDMRVRGLCDTFIATHEIIRVTIVEHFYAYTVHVMRFQIFYIVIFFNSRDENFAFQRLLIHRICWILFSGLYDCCLEIMSTNYTEILLSPTNPLSVAQKGDFSRGT